MIRIFKRLLLLGIFVMVGFITIGCFENTTTDNTQQSTSTSNNTTDSTTITNTTEDTTTIGITTTESTTTNNTTTQPPATTTTTTLMEEEYENLDELNISLNRLDNAIFEIDFDSIFADSFISNESQTTDLSYQSKSYQITRLASGNEDETYNPEDYTRHPYWNQFAYNNSIFEMPNEVNNMYIFDTTLNSFNNLAMNNLYDCAESQTRAAKELSNWAIDHITVMDTWIINDNLDRKFLLNYDDTNDQVNLYSIYDIEIYNTMSYEKTTIYYNQKGEEVIEYWVNQVDFNSGRTVNIYYNSIAARDFNYYNNEVYDSGATYHHYRGVNLGSDGHYTYYDNTWGIKSGDYGWYSYSPRVNVSEELIDNDYNPTIHVYCPNGDSNVIKINQYGDVYHISLYLPSMDGLEGIVIEKDGLTTDNVDSLSTQEFLINEGYIPLPDYYTLDDQSIYVTGIDTINGRFLTTDGLWNDSVLLKSVELDIGFEGEREYAEYAKYYGILNLDVTASNVESALDELYAYLNHLGLTYKYDDINLLFDETAEFFENYNAIIKNIRITNDVMHIDDFPYADFTSLGQTYNDIKDYIMIKDTIIDMQTLYDEINMEDMPLNTGVNTVEFIQLNDHFDGVASISELGIDTSDLTFTFNQSPILQGDKNYTIFYALSVQDKDYIIGQEANQLYQYVDLVIDGNALINIEPTLIDGTYAFTMFLGKVTEEGYVRISDVVPIPISSFTAFEKDVINSELGGSFDLRYLYNEGVSYLDTTFIDTTPPNVGFETVMAILSGDVLLDTPLDFNVTSTIETLLEYILFVEDNYDEEIIYGYSNFTFNGVIVNNFTDPILTGDYTFTVSDQAGNSTTISFTINVYCNVTFLDQDSNIIDEQMVVYGGTAVAPAVEEMEGFTITWSGELDNITENVYLVLSYVMDE